MNTHLIGCVLFGIYRQLQKKLKLPCSARIVSPRDITRSAFLAQAEPKLHLEILQGTLFNAYGRLIQAY